MKRSALPASLLLSAEVNGVSVDSRPIAYRLLVSWLARHWRTLPVPEPCSTVCGGVPEVGQAMASPSAAPVLLDETICGADGLHLVECEPSVGLEPPRKKISDECWVPEDGCRRAT